MNIDKSVPLIPSLTAVIASFQSITIQIKGKKIVAQKMDASVEKNASVIISILN